MFALSASGLAVPRGFAGGGGPLYIEAFPTSPADPQPVQRSVADPAGAAAGREVGRGHVEEPAGPEQPGLGEGRAAVQASAVAGSGGDGVVPVGDDHAGRVPGQALLSIGWTSDVVKS